MDLGASFRAAYRTYFARAGGILPFYLLGSAVPAVARTLPVIALLVAGIAVSRSGELATVREELAAIGPLAYEDFAEPTTAEPVSDELLTAAEELFLRPEVLGPLVISGVVAVIVFIVANAAVTAGQIHSVTATAGGTTDLHAGIAGIRRHTVTFLGLLLVEVLAYGIVVGGVVVVVAGAASVAAPAVVPAGLLGGLIILGALPSIRLIFAFAPIVAVVEDTGLRRAVSGAVAFAVDRPWAVLGYAGVFVAALTAVGTLAAVLTQLGAEVVTGLVVLLVVSPILDTLKTILYGGTRTYEPVATLPPVKHTVVNGIRNGVDELLAFVRHNRGLLLVSGAIFAVTGYAGWVAGGFLEGIVTTSIERRLEDAMPVGDLLFYFGNNWQVAYASAFAGLGLAIPTVVSLATNGLILGGIARLEVTPELLAAFIIPHGVVEIPGLVVAGALGLYLGVVVWRRLRGQVPTTRLVEAFGHAYRVTLGLILVFAVAAVIEAFISPYYWRLLGL